MSQQSASSSFTSKYALVSLSNDIKTETSNYVLPIMPENNKIIDSRPLMAFKNQTFGGYNKGAAMSALDKSIMDEKIEPVIYWTLQLFFSGCVHNLWDRLYNTAAKLVNIANPHMPIYLQNRNLTWHHIVMQQVFGYGAGEKSMALRNHPEIRNMLIEMATIITLSKRRKMDAMPKIKKEDFILEQFQLLLEGANVPQCVAMIEPLLLPEDTKEARVASIEFAYALYHSRMQKALYWLNWLLTWEHMNTRRYGKFECNMRNVEGVDSKYRKQVIWLIWDVVMHVLDVRAKITSGHGGLEQTAEQIRTQIYCLKALFCMNYKSFTGSGRKLHFLVWAISYLTCPIDWSTQLFDRPAVLFQVLFNQEKLLPRFKAQSVMSKNSQLLTQLGKVAVVNTYGPRALVNPASLQQSQYVNPNYNPIGVPSQSVVKQSRSKIMPISYASVRDGTLTQIKEQEYMAQGLRAMEKQETARATQMRTPMLEPGGEPDTTTTTTTAKRGRNTTQLSEESKKKLEIMADIDKILFA